MSAVIKFPIERVQRSSSRKMSDPETAVILEFGKREISAYFNSRAASLNKENKSKVHGPKSRN